ncbi:Cell division control protein 48 B, partial [Tetrabaena socialis]
MGSSCASRSRVVGCTRSGRTVKVRQGPEPAAPPAPARRGCRNNHADGATASGPAALPPPPPPRRVAGASAALQALRELVGWPVLYGEAGAALGVRWPRGLLLHGPPGCGKTLLVQAVAEEYGAVLHVVTASRVLGAYTGESERRLRGVFAAAQADADAGRTSVVFLDEVDALCPRRDGGRAHDSRVVAQLLTLLDGAASSRDTGPAPPPSTSYGTPPDAATLGGGGGGGRRGHLVVVGATNRPNALDPAVRRPGRLDREVLVALPDATQRLEILGLHTRGLQLAPGADLPAVAAACHGYSGADLAAVAREAAMAALAEVAAETYGIGAAATAAPLGAVRQGAAATPPPVLVVGGSHLAAALVRIRPSIVRGAEVDIPPVSWDDVGGLEEVKRRLKQAVEWPLQHAAAFERLGLAAPRGVLLHGPP